MVTPDLVNTIEEHLAVGGRLFIQTDIEFLAEEMFELFRMRTAFKEIPIVESPFPVKTEREIAVESKGLPVYRALWERV